MRLILGFDPGGEKKFGWCIATDFENRLEILKSGTDNNASNAVSAVIKFINTIETEVEVIAAGIDSPLFWIANGDREVDKIVRKAIAKKGGNTSTVMAVNSLKGACLIQGIMTAVTLRKHFEKIPMTEAHPKAVIKLGVLERHPEFLSVKSSEDERDAAISALSAWAMIYNNDSWENIYPKEKNPFSPIEAPLAYWIPKITHK